MIILICNFLTKANEAGIYNFSKDFVVPSLSIFLSAVVAYLVANRQIHGQRKLNIEEEEKKKGLLFNVVDIQNQFLIEELNNRNNEISKLLRDLEKEDVTSGINELYLSSLTRLNKLDYKELHDVFLNTSYSTEETMKTFLLFHNSLIHLEKNVIMINNSGKKYYNESNENFERLKILYKNFNFDIAQLVKNNKINDVSFFLEFENKFSPESSFDKYFDYNISLVDEVINRIKQTYNIEYFELLKIVSEIRNLGLIQRQNLIRYKVDLDFFLKISEDNTTHLERMKNIISKNNLK